MKQRKSFRILFPTFQRRLLAFVLVSAGSTVILSVCLTAARISSLARSLPNDGQLVMDSLTGLMMRDILIALGIALPAMGLLALVATMPLFGVFFRFRSFLTDVIEGSETEPCSLRQNDPMANVAELLNAATEAQRKLNAQNQGREAA